MAEQQKGCDFCGSLKTGHSPYKDCVGELHERLANEVHYRREAERMLSCATELRRPYEDDRAKGEYMIYFQERHGCEMEDDEIQHPGWYVRHEQTLPKVPMGEAVQGYEYLTMDGEWVKFNEHIPYQAFLTLEEAWYALEEAMDEEEGQSG